MLRNTVAVAALMMAVSSLCASEKTSQDAAILKKISASEWWDNCKKYGKIRRSKSTGKEFEILRDYLLKNNYMNGIDLVAVANKTISIGMTQCGVVAVMGLPTRINGHKSRTGSRDQMVFENNSIRYIYTADSPSERTQVVTSYSTRN